MDYEAEFARIDLLCSAISDELQRQQEARRLIDQLYEGWGSMTEGERDALDDAHQAWMDERDRKGIVALSEWCEGEECELIAATHPDSLERIADAWANQDSRTVRNLRDQARTRRAQLRSIAPAPVAILRVRGAHGRTPRPRGRRERHVARATSSASSGDSSGEPDEPPLARPSRAFRRPRPVPRARARLHERRWRT